MGVETQTQDGYTMIRCGDEVDYVIFSVAAMRRLADRWRGDPDVDVSHWAESAIGHLRRDWHKDPGRLPSLGCDVHRAIIRIGFCPGEFPSPEMMIVGKCGNCWSHAEATGSDYIPSVIEMQRSLSEIPKRIGISDWHQVQGVDGPGIREFSIPS